MSVIVGQLTLPDDQAAALNPIAQRIAAMLANRIEPVTIVVKPRADMPEYLPGKHARGYWKERTRKILLADDLFAAGEPLDETLGHEVVHTLFSDWLTKWHRNELLALVTPAPDSFGDLSVDDLHVGYPASAEECCCVWGSAAIFGFDPPAYVGIYKRTIAKSDLPAVREILLNDPDMGPPPVDPCQPLRDRVAILEARKAEIAADLEELMSSLRTTANKVRH